MKWQTACRVSPYMTAITRNGNGKVYERFITGRTVTSDENGKAVEVPKNEADRITEWLPKKIRHCWK